MTSPQWPAGLREDTPLPYEIWRVMHYVDGRREIQDVARRANLSVPEVEHTLQEAQRWLTRATQVQQLVTPELTQQVTQALTSVVGPVAALMVDEVLESAGAHATLQSLLAGLAEQLTSEKVQLFVRQLHERGLT